MAELKCHFDGTSIVLDEPVKLVLNVPFTVTVDDSVVEASEPVVKKREFNQFKGQAWMSDDFNDPMPDSFWNGEE